MKRIIFTFIAIALALATLLTSVEFVSYNDGNYKSYQLKHNLSEAAGITQQELDIVTTDLIEYLKKGDNKLLEPHYNEREIAHMEDVYVLFANGTIIRNVLIVLLLILVVYAFKKYDTLESLRYMNFSMIGIWIASLLMFVLTLTSFSDSFVKFHHIFFDNDLWMLNPETDMMIRMLPEGFFNELTVKIVITYISVLLIVHLGVLITRRILMKRGLRDDTKS